MALTWPLALALALAVLPAAWLARRAGGRTIDHPLWFLAPPGAAARRHRASATWRHALVLAAIALAALAAAGPVRDAGGGDRVLVVDLSATRALDVAAIRARVAGYDRVVLAAPGAAPRVVAAATAGPAIVPGRGTTDAATLAAAVEAGLPGARVLDVAAAPPVGADVGIAAVRFHRDPLAAARGWLVIELRDPAGACDRRVVIASGDRERARLTPWCGGGRGVAVWSYAGAGDEVVAVRLDPAGRDAIAIDDEAAATIPTLAPSAVWLAPALASSDVARALRALPTVQLVPTLVDGAIAVVPADSAGVRARARLVIHPPPPTAARAPLALADAAPLPGMTPALLAATPAVAVDASAGVDADPARTWLRAGADPAVWTTADAAHVAVALDGAALPVLLADLIAAAPLAHPAPPAAVVDVRAPPAAPAVAPAAPGGRPWPITALLVVVAALIGLEALVTRPRRHALALRVATLAAVLIAARVATTRAPRRVVFVLDVSTSVAPVEGDARAALAQRAAALADDDRAAVVLVAGGATIAVPLGPPAAVVAWARRGPIDVAGRGLDPATTDLRAGVALAATIADPGDALVLIGDGRDRRGAGALAGAPGLIGRGVEVEPIDAGDRGRIEARTATVRAAPGQPAAIAVAVELRARATVTIVATTRGAQVGRLVTPLAAGRSVVAVPVTLADVGVADVDLALTVPGDPVALGDHAHVTVEVGGAARRLVITDASLGAVHPSTLAAVDEVILDDVPALPADAAASLDGFVRGGGTLVWAAGPATAAAGIGALAGVLPLRAPPPPRLALVLVIDRSGSIGAPDTAAVAAGPAEVAAAAALEPTDYVGALAFDVAPIEWVPFAPVGAGVVVRDLPPPRGGTDPSAAIDRAGEVLRGAPADARPVIALVSDGGFPATLDAAVRAAAAAAARGVRVETFATGAVDAAGADRLCRVAAAGGGACHAATRALALVRAVAPPATRVGPLRLRGAPATAAPGAMVEHLALAPAADAVVLGDAGDDPILAVRAHGAGRVVGWASDRRGAWGDGQVAAAAIDAAVARPATAAVAVRPVDDRLDLTIAQDADLPAPALGVAITADERVAVVLSPAPPGRAIGAVPISDAGTFEFGGARSAYVPPHPECRGLGADPAGFPSSRAVRRPSDRPRPAAAWLAGLSILLMLATLSLPERRLVTARDFDEDDNV